MAAKTFLVFCLQTLLIQSAFSRCVGPAIGAGLAPAGLAYDGLALGAGCAPFTPAASVGGSFIVTSASPVAPTGVSVVSENVYEGALVIGGSLPLLGSVGLEGEFPTAGAGAVSYGCGDDAVAIVAEKGPIATGIVAPINPGYSYGIAPFGYGLGYGIAPFEYGFGYGIAPFEYGFGYGNGFVPGAFGLGYGAFGAGCGCGAIY